MTVTRFKSAGGFTLVEVMIAAAILSVAVIGASGYRYYAAIDAQRAARHTAAARLGLLLCESWRGTRGSLTYNPVTHLSPVLAITVPTEADNDYSYLAHLSYIAGIPQDFTKLGTYRVTLNDDKYYPILSYKDTGNGLRLLNVAVVWPLQGRTDNWYPSPYTCKVFKLTTYTQN